MNLKRFDTERGFLITHNGLPYQAMRRGNWYYSYGRLCSDSEYWLTGEAMSHMMAMFVYSEFSDILAQEFRRTHAV